LIDGLDVNFLAGTFDLPGRLKRSTVAWRPCCPRVLWPSQPLYFHASLRLQCLCLFVGRGVEKAGDVLLMTRHPCDLKIKGLMVPRVQAGRQTDRQADRQTDR